MKNCVCNQKLGKCVARPSQSPELFVPLKVQFLKLRLVMAICVCQVSARPVNWFEPSDDKSVSQSAHAIHRIIILYKDGVRILFRLNKPVNGEQKL